MRRLAIACVLLLTASLALADTLFVTEFQGYSQTNSVYYQAATTPAIAAQAISVTGASTQSAAFNVSTGLVRVHADVACHVVIGGTNPTATANSMPLTVGQTEYFVVRAGDKLAVIIAP